MTDEASYFMNSGTGTRLVSLILIGVLTAIFFGLRAEHGRRARAFRYHTMKSFEVMPTPDPSQNPTPIPEALWHAEEARRQTPWLQWLDLAVVIDAGTIVAMLAVAGFVRVVAWAAGPARLRGRLRLATAVVLVAALAITLGLGREWCVRSTEEALDPAIEMASQPGSRMDDFYKLMKVFDFVRPRGAYIYGISFDSPTEAKLYYSDGGKLRGIIEMKKNGDKNWEAPGGNRLLQRLRHRRAGHAVCSWGMATIRVRMGHWGVEVGQDRVFRGAPPVPRGTLAVQSAPKRCVRSRSAIANGVRLQHEHVKGRRRVKTA